MRRLITYLWFILLVPAAEGADMQYVIVTYPAKIAAALLDFAGKLPGGEATFTDKDLVIGADSASRYRFGVAERRADPATEPLRRTYLAAVDDEGKLTAIAADTGPMPSERVVEGGVARAVLVGLATHRKAGGDTPLATIGWRVLDDTVTVMFAPRRSETEGAIVGGTTSLGADVLYHVSRSQLKVTRTSLGR